MLVGSLAVAARKEMARYRTKVQRRRARRAKKQRDMRLARYHRFLTMNRLLTL